MAGQMRDVPVQIVGARVERFRAVEDVYPSPGRSVGERACSIDTLASTGADERCASGCATCGPPV